MNLYLAKSKEHYLSMKSLFCLTQLARKYLSISATSSLQCQANNCFYLAPDLVNKILFLNITTSISKCFHHKKVYLILNNFVLIINSLYLILVIIIEHLIFSNVSYKINKLLKLQTKNLQNLATLILVFK